MKPSLSDLKRILLGLIDEGQLSDPSSSTQLASDKVKVFEEETYNIEKWGK